MKRDRASGRRPRASLRSLSIAGAFTWSVAAVAALMAASSIAQESATTPAPGSAAAAGTASPAELEVLRKLLGLPPDPPAVREAPRAVEPPAGTAVETTEPARATPPPATPATLQEPIGKPAGKPAAKPAKKPEPKREPRSLPSAKSTPPSSSTTSSTAAPAPASPSTTAPPAAAPATTIVEPAIEAAPPAAEPRIEAAPQDTTAEPPTKAAPKHAGSASVAIPKSGSIVSTRNLAEWKHLLGPSMQWSIERGATLEIVDPKPIALEPARLEATQRYHAQVELAPDKRSMRNYVAGLPFPFVDGADPDAGAKMMFNMEHRIVQDDLDGRNFRCDTGTLDPREGFSIQRSYLIDHFRRLYSVGRLWVDPKPLMPDPENARYREMLYPIREPFDLKGAGFTYLRYLDPNRQDDSWLYFPQLKRVRRLSTAQRSEGIFGQDVDLDSYGGFAGNPAWTSWTYLGKKTLLISMHARTETDKFQSKPADFFPNDVWEARDVHVILGISQLGGYNFGRRIIYLDAENWTVPYTEIYDLKGQLWRSLIHTWKAGDRPRPNAKRAIHDYETIFINAFTLIDMQQEHATRCQFPAPDMKDEDGWYYVFGAAEGTTREEFAITNFVGSGR